MNQLGRALLEADPPIALLFVYNSNPAATTPDQRRVLRGLEREDLFTVVFDQVMTDTARYADVLLPNTTFLEGYDLVKSYGPWTMGLGRPVIEPIGESRCNADVFGALLELTGLGEASDPHGELEEMLDVLSRLPGTTGDEMRDCGAATAPFDGRPVQFRDVFPRTADQKIDLYPEVLANQSAAGLYVYLPDPGTQEYPLALISPASDRTISSTLAEIPRRSVASRTPMKCGSSTRSARCAATRASEAGSAAAPSRCRRGSGGSTRPTATRAPRSCPTR
jgi:anaerobic selenocysteine-containing dehydrogenase